MKKLLVFLALLIPFTAISQVSVKISTPKNIKLDGSVFQINVEIDKKDLTQYGGFYLELPEEFTIITKSLTGSSFFINGKNKLKIGWSVMPITDKLTFNLSVKSAKVAKDFKIRYMFEYQAFDNFGTTGFKTIEYKVSNNIATKTETPKGTQVSGNQINKQNADSQDFSVFFND